jgi:type II secretory pathway predicted ATPase ExeA
MRSNPFAKAIPETQRFMSRDFKEMSDRLERIKDIRGIGVFTAPPGCGKTFALRCFAKGLNPTLYHTAYICLATVSVTEFYSQLCAALGVDASQRKAAMFRSIQQRLHAMYKEQRRPLILALDEAHELDARILKDIKMIMNHDYDSVDCFTLILLGEPHLNASLQKPAHEALRQRIVIHYNFEGLSPDETSRYILHKLESAGAAASVVGDGVMNAVHGYAHGRPRQIDCLMECALTLAAQRNQTVLDTDTVFAAMNLMELA